MGYIGSHMVPVLNTIGTDVACVGVCPPHAKKVMTTY